MSLGASKVAMLGAAGVTEDVVLLATANASGSASLEFTSGVTSSYGNISLSFTIYILLVMAHLVFNSK